MTKGDTVVIVIAMVIVIITSINVVRNVKLSFLSESDRKENKVKFKKSASPVKETSVKEADPHPPIRVDFSEISDSISLSKFRGFENDRFGLIGAVTCTTRCR